jgi:hypothetical protein
MVALTRETLCAEGLGMNKYLSMLLVLFFISNTNAEYLNPDDVVTEFLQDLNKLNVEGNE